MARLADCQPLKGERVQVTEVKTGVDGRCSGNVGWVGMRKLEAAQPQR
jgi:hypothetical protein